MTFKNRLWNWADADRLRQHEDKVLLVLTLVIGAIVGLVIASFILVTENLGARMYPAGGAPWRRLTIPVLGALVTGVLLYKYFPNARGSGIPQTKTALFLHDGLIRLRTVLGKFGLSSVSLASGISLGREGPSVQVGAGIASVLGRWLGLGPIRVKALVPIGASAALAAAFNTPVAAVLFTLEEVMGDMHAPVLGSIVLSSATSWIVLHLVLGDEPLFHVPSYQLVHPLEFLVYAALGIIGGLVSVCFVKLLLWQRKYFLRMPALGQALQPVAGGLLVGVLGWFVPQVLGVGYSHVSEALNSQLPLRLMVLLVVLKLVATATCYASGNAGGIFGPALFIGAMMGGAVGGTAHSLLPDYTGSAGAYALVGMGAAFAGIIRVPLTSVIMIFEVTRDYTIIVPLMIANLISFFISQRMQREPIYEALQHQDGIHLPAGGRDREVPLLVKDAARAPQEVLPKSVALTDALHSLNVELNAWPVVDEERLVGMLRIGELEKAVREGHGDWKIADLLPTSQPLESLTAETFPHVHEDHPLDTALRRMSQAQMNVLPVVSRANVRQLKGIITRRDILDAYELGGSRGKRPEANGEHTVAPGMLLAGVVVATLGILILIGFLSYSYRAERQVRARNDFENGNALLRQDRIGDAIEQYRNALSISRDKGEYRLALGLALVKARHFNEAGIYLQQLLKADADNGRANLGMAQIAAAQGRVQDAVTYYHRAIYGTWLSSAGDERIQARFELVDFLVKNGQGKQALSELLALAEQGPKNPQVKKRVGRLLLSLGSWRQAADEFREVLRENDRDAEASAGFGEAEFALGSYRIAQHAFEVSLKWNPTDENVKGRLQVCNEILAIDPAIRGLSSKDRYRRSIRVLNEALDRVQSCLSAHENEATPEVQQLVAGAQKVLRRTARSDLSDVTQDNLSLAEQLWTKRARICGPPAAADQALDLVLRSATK
jgi:CIC family chloride channel protein